MNVDQYAVRKRCWDIFKDETWSVPTLEGIAAFTEQAAIRPEDTDSLAVTEYMWLYDGKGRRLSRETLLAIASELRQEIARRKVKGESCA